MADEPSPNPPPEKPSLGELWDNRVFRIAVIAILLAVFALLFVWDRNRHGLALGLEGRMCRSDDEHITCLRDWLAIVG